MDIRTATETLGRHKKKTAAATGGAVVLGGVPLVILKVFLALQNDVTTLKAENNYLRRDLDATRKQIEDDRRLSWNHGSALEYNINLIRPRVGLDGPMQTDWKR